MTPDSMGAAETLLVVDVIGGESLSRRGLPRLVLDALEKDQVPGAERNLLGTWIYEGDKRIRCDSPQLL